MWYGCLNENGPPVLTLWNTNLVEVLGKDWEVASLLEGVCHRREDLRFQKLIPFPVSRSLYHMLVSQDVPVCCHVPCRMVMNSVLLGT